MRFPLDHFVDEISSFNRPLIWLGWNIAFLDLNLFGQNMIPDFFSWFTLVWSFSKHTLKRHHTNCKVIYSGCMILSAHYFRCHVPGSTGCILCILRSPHPCNTKIGDSQIAIVINNKIFWLYVSMDDILLVAVFKTSN